MFKNFEDKKVGRIIQQYMLTVFLAAFAVSLVGFIAVQIVYRRFYAYSLVEEYVRDADSSIDEEYDKLLEEYVKQGRDAIEQDPAEYRDNAALVKTVEHNSRTLSEVNIVNSDGIIIYSSKPDYVGYDMGSGTQSKEFLCLLNGEDYFAQELRDNSFDDSRMVYAGASFSDGSGFVQLGISEENYVNIRNRMLAESARHRRVGINGYIVICDKDLNIIGSTNDLFNGRTLQRSGIIPDKGEEYRASRVELFGTDCYVAVISNPGYYVIGGFPVSEAERSELIDELLILLMSVIILGCVLLALSQLLKIHVVKGIEDINSSLSEITAGHLEEKVSVVSSLEFKELSGGINDTVDRLKAMIAEAETRIDKELETARRIQTSAVPNVFPPFPDNDSFGLFALMDTAKAVGGDFYDFFMVSENVIALVIADVSGKGLPAALFMMKAKALIKTYAEEDLPIEEAAVEINKKLCEENDEHMFVTVWFGLLDLDSGIISYVHAGHTYPVLFGEGGARYVNQKRSLFFGYMKQAKFIRQEIELKPGDTLFLYTDGVTEAKNVNDELYGEERLIELIRDKSMKTDKSDRNRFCKEVCEIVYNDVKGFVGQAEQSDDITMLCLSLPDTH